MVRKAAATIVAIIAVTVGTIVYLFASDARGDFESPCDTHAECELKLIRAEQRIASKNDRLALKNVKLEFLRNELRYERKH